MKRFDQRKGKDLMVDLNKTYNEVKHGINSSKRYCEEVDEVEDGY